MPDLGVVKVLYLRSSGLLTASKCDQAPTSMYSTNSSRMSASSNYDSKYCSP